MDAAGRRTRCNSPTVVGCANTTPGAPGGCAGFVLSGTGVRRGAGRRLPVTGGKIWPGIAPEATDLAGSEDRQPVAAIPMQARLTTPASCFAHRDQDRPALLYLRALRAHDGLELFRPVVDAIDYPTQVAGGREDQGAASEINSAGVIIAERIPCAELIGSISRSPRRRDPARVPRADGRRGRPPPVSHRPPARGSDRGWSRPPRSARPPPRRGADRRRRRR